MQWVHDCMSHSAARVLVCIGWAVTVWWVGIIVLKVTVCHIGQWWVSDGLAAEVGRDN